MACLPQGPAEHGKACWVGGWGTTSWQGQVSDVLMSVGVNTFSDEYCRQHRNVQPPCFFLKIFVNQVQSGGFKGLKVDGPSNSRGP